LAVVAMVFDVQLRSSLNRQNTMRMQLERL